MTLRRAMAIVLTVISGIVGGLFFVSPASAAIEDCGNYPGTVCFADTRTWGGQIWRQYPSQIRGCTKFSAASFDNEASIGVNNTDSSIGVYLYEHSTCTGQTLFVASGNAVKLWLATPNIENKASAIKVVYF